MVPVYVTTVDVDPGLFLVDDFPLCQAGKGQGVEANGALGPGGVQFLAKGLQLFKSGGVA